jgi:NAD(P)-dependent dehydrogenase (short-subunit alcohol dehydrogenase family)
MAGDRKLALITGAAGFVGSRIARRFLREGMSVRALDRRAIDAAELEACVGDVTDPGVAHRAIEGVELLGVSPCPSVKRQCRGAGASAGRRPSGSWATSLAFRMKRRCWKSSATSLKGDGPTRDAVAASEPLRGVTSC